MYYFNMTYLLPFYLFVLYNSIGACVFFFFIFKSSSSVILWLVKKCICKHMSTLECFGKVGKWNIRQPLSVVRIYGYYPKHYNWSASMQKDLFTVLRYFRQNEVHTQKKPELLTMNNE